MSPAKKPHHGRGKEPRSLRRRRWPAAALPVVAVALMWSVAAAAVAHPGPGPGAPAYECVGPPTMLVDNWNGGAVQNGGTDPSFSTNGQPYCLMQIDTYHWNGGSGATPGTIGLLGELGNIGPYDAIGTAGSGGAPNVNWTASPSAGGTPVIIDGTYACNDSDPSTWSQNSGSGGAGFCRVTVEQAQQLPAPTPTNPTTPTAPTTPTPTTPPNNPHPVACGPCPCSTAGAGFTTTTGPVTVADVRSAGYASIAPAFVMAPQPVNLGPTGPCSHITITKRAFYLTNPGQNPPVWTNPGQNPPVWRELTGNEAGRTATTNTTASDHGQQVPVAELKFEITIVNRGPGDATDIKVEDKELLPCIRDRNLMPTVSGTGSGTPFSNYNGADQGAKGISVPRNGGTVTVTINCKSRVKHIWTNVAAVYGKNGIPHTSVKSVLIDVRKPGR